MNIKELMAKVEGLGWSVYEDNGTYDLGKFSSAGQDFSIHVTGDSAEDIVESIYECYEGYDVSEEASLWLDDSGHGSNGAPYDMKDLYEDMEECKENILELYEELNKIF